MEPGEGIGRLTDGRAERIPAALASAAGIGR